jgi:hypothetical protein
MLCWGGLFWGFFATICSRIYGAKKFVRKKPAGTVRFLDETVPAGLGFDYAFGSEVLSAATGGAGVKADGRTMRLMRGSAGNGLRSRWTRQQ